MKKEAKQWLDQASYDFEVARSLYRSGRYPYTFFFCHLSVEKALKACIIEYTDAFPPRTHNLPKLAEQAKIELPADFSNFIDSLSKEGVRSRYPKDLRVFTKSKASDCLAQTEKVLSWLRQKLTSNP